MPPLLQQNYPIHESFFSTGGDNLLDLPCNDWPCMSSKGDTIIETTSAKTLTCIAEPQGKEDLKIGYAFGLGAFPKMSKRIIVP